MVNPQKKPERPPSWLLVSDVDDTLTGDDDALASFVEAIAASPNLLVALNSSRPRKSVQATLARFPSPFQPAGLITAMGTEVTIGEPVPAWQERFVGWDRSLVDRVLSDLGARPHADEFQTEFKASYEVEGADRQAAARDALVSCGQAVRIIASGRSDFDVIPPAAGKGEATLFLATTLGISVTENLVVAGDSGNDLAMFEVARRGILVGNARPELRQAVSPETAYQARRDHAAGVLEGLQHWGAPLATAPRNPSHHNH